jgi:NADH:ubiquinone oxidoreductase subunit E
MTTTAQDIAREVCRTYESDSTRLLDIARDIQSRLGCVPAAAIDAIHQELGIPQVRIRSLVSFYAFLSEEPQGKIVIRLCDDVVDRLFGYERVLRAFSEELGIGVGETTSDGEISLARTACIGMSDQAPAALVGDVVVTELSSDRRARSSPPSARTARRAGWCRSWATATTPTNWCARWFETTSARRGRSCSPTAQPTRRFTKRPP